MKTFLKISGVIILIFIVITVVLNVILDSKIIPVESYTK